MSCSESPVAQQARKDCVAAFGGKVYDLGILGDQSHQTHRSGHNCAPLQESGSYNPGFAHAWDAGHKIGDVATALAVRLGFLRDPRTRYVIDRGIGYYPNGSWFRSTGHQDHDHISFNPGTTFDTRPFTFNQGDDQEMLSKEAQDFIDKRLSEQDDRIVARVKNELVGTKAKPKGLAVLVQHNRDKLVRLLKAAGLPTND